MNHIDDDILGTSKEARKIVNDFLPAKILERFDHCINSPASKGRIKTELF